MVTLSKHDGNAPLGLFLVIGVERPRGFLSAPEDFAIIAVDYDGDTAAGCVQLEAWGFNALSCRWFAPCQNFAKPLVHFHPTSTLFCTVQFFLFPSSCITTPEHYLSCLIADPKQEPGTWRLSTTCAVFVSTDTARVRPLLSLIPTALPCHEVG